MSRPWPLRSALSLTALTALLLAGCAQTGPAPEELSGGMSQRVAIAVAAARNPTICFIDEPTSGLDPITRRRMKFAMRAARHRFGTLLIATHDVEFVAGLVDRVLVMRNGRILFDGTLRSAFASADPYVQQFVAPD